MTKVTSKKSISFPKLKWAISAGDWKELPEDEDAQLIILQNPDILMGEEHAKPPKEKEHIKK